MDYFKCYEISEYHTGFADGMKEPTNDMINIGYAKGVKVLS